MGRDEVITELQNGLPGDIKEQEVEAELKKRNRKTYYHGWNTVCDLCTGDISNVLELLDRLYRECNIGKSRVEKIQPSYQHSIIQTYSLQYINKIKGIPHYGERLFDIVNAFGNMSARLLREYPWMERNEDRRDPYQLIRIELDEGFVHSLDGEENVSYSTEPDKNADAKSEAIALWMLLQRYCLFIDADESRSRRNTLASKVILRRIFCPGFRTTLVNSESFTIDKKKWEAFCSDPTGSADRYIRAVVEEAKRKRGDQMELFEKLPKGSNDNA